jgi:hypothetical protein
VAKVFSGSQALLGNPIGSQVLLGKELAKFILKILIEMNCPSQAWVPRAFPSATWEREEKRK